MSNSSAIFLPAVDLVRWIYARDRNGSHRSRSYSRDRIRKAVYF
ncbi:hypothetical protein [Nostoc sp.]